MMYVDISFRCKKCKANNSIKVELMGPDWDFDDFFEDVQDPSAITMTEEWPLECIDCDEEHYIYLEHNGFGADMEIEDLPVSEYSISSVKFDSGLDWLSAIGLSSRLWKEEVFKNYLVSIADIKSIIKSQATDNGYSLINRMLLTQIISSFEAYLGDTLIQQVKGHQEAIEAMVTKNTELSSKKYTLKQIISQPNIVEENVLSYLGDIIYHNLSKTEALYKIALNINLPIDKADRPELYRAIKYRHDCVHRNGFDARGVRLEVFNKEYLAKIQELTESIARNLQALVKINA